MPDYAVVKSTERVGLFAFSNIGSSCIRLQSTSVSKLFRQEWDGATDPISKNSVKPEIPN